MNDIPSCLQTIVEANRPQREQLVQQHSLEQLLERAQNAPAPRGFCRALKAASGVTLIAEVKKASPSAGVIRADFDPVWLARQYEQGGASCISVLTEQQHFQGDPAYLQQLRDAVGLPLLRKDFLVCGHQIAEARLLGADAVLLIVALLDNDQLTTLQSLAWRLQLDALVEVHTHHELDRALECGCELIGINNRDLHTFNVDTRTTLDLCDLLPDDCVVVSESGIRTRADVQQLAASNVDAMLVGETLSRADDPAATARILLGN